MNRRQLTSLGLVALIIAFPYWIYLPAIILSMIFLPFYFEAILLGFLIDVLYGVHTHTGITVFFGHAFFITLFIIIYLPIRKYFR